MMRRITILLIITAFGLSACGTVRDSRINPFNWFGGGREAPAEQPQSDNPLIPERTGGIFGSSRAEREAYTGVPVDVVRDIIVEQVPGGAIVRATGVSRYQNVFDVQLTPADDDEAEEDGVLDFRLEARIPRKPVAGGPERLRTFVAARVLTENDLEGVTQIRVSAADNARVTSRR